MAEDGQIPTGESWPSPYKGLVPFEETDAPLFFGREFETRVITNNLLASRLTLLYGPAGGGKSSLLRAGVKHDLSSRAKLSGEEHSTEFVVVILSSWLGDSSSELTRLIKQSLDLLFPARVPQENTHTLSDTIARYTHSLDVELMIILDQFEEYFVYHPHLEDDGDFADQFAQAVANASLRAHFLISIREDWLARLDYFKGRIPNLFANSIRIEHLERNAAREAIVRPIEEYNRLVHEDVKRPNVVPNKQIVITDDFIFEVLNQLSSVNESNGVAFESNSPQRQARISKERIQPAHLQIALQHLWTKIRNDSQPTFGAELLAKPVTAGWIIESHIQMSLAHLSRREQLVASELFPFLTTPSGTKIASTAEGLAARCARRLDQVSPLLERLSAPDIRILNRMAPAPGQSNQELYELTSDMLTGPTLDWAKQVTLKRRRTTVVRNYILSMLVLVAIATLTIELFKAQQQRSAALERQLFFQSEGARAERALDLVRKLDESVPYSRAVLRGNGGGVTSALFTADGRVLIASMDGSAMLWDIKSNYPIRVFDVDETYENALICAAISPQGTTVVTANAAGAVFLWDLATNGRKQLRDSVGTHVTDLTFSPDGDLIAAGNTNGAIVVWHRVSGARTEVKPENGKAIKQISFSPSGELLASASDDNVVNIWRSNDWSPISVLTGHLVDANALAFSPEEKLIAAASRDGTIRVWSISTGALTHVFKGHEKGVNSVAFSSNGHLLLTASDDTTARIWNLDRSTSLVLLGHTDKVLSASFSPNDQQVVTASRDATARIWSVNTARSWVELRGHLGEVTHVSYSKDGRYILTASSDGTARVWFAPEPSP